MERMSGLIAEGERKAGTTMTVSPDTLEPFAFHAAFVGVAILIGWYLLSFRVRGSSVASPSTVCRPV
jgi:hypothetical protein